MLYHIGDYPAIRKSGKAKLGKAKFTVITVFLSEPGEDGSEVYHGTFGLLDMAFPAMRGGK